MNTPQPATPSTAAANGAPIERFDSEDFIRAERGLLAEHPTGVITSAFGTVWDVNRYAFIERGSPNPPTVNPSLWRQSQLNGIHGLFEVAPGLWQVRGYDISNITFVAGASGWIVIDPLTAAPCAAAALELANHVLGERPVVAVIYTHSHADHFGGVLGVTTREAVRDGQCRVIAPEHFMRETVGENVIAGHAMMRRAAYQFGPLLPVGPMGQVDCGLGKNIPFYPQDLVAPTEEITATGEELVVDGVRIVFQLTPEAEAPAEMNFFFPDQGWLCTAENCTHNMHNLVPIRGAQVRDALKWSKYIDEAIRMFGDRTELSFASHHWPRWGNEDVLGYLRIQRDLYRWIHDQTMRWANHGLGPLEIAELLSLPPEFAQHSHTVGYYGHLAHNVKAVYQRYLSWYDGNPSNLWRLPPTQSGPLYVDLAGGMDALVAHAQRHFDTGAYRWVVELLAHAVNADPAHQPARLLQAAAFEQLGYQSESATFRNAFLMAAQELRHGTLPRALSGQGGYLAAMSPDQLFDAWAVRLRSEDLGGHNGRIRFEFVDAEPWTVELSHRTLHAWPASNDAADLRLRGSTDAIRQILEHRTDLEALESEGLIEVIAGNRDIMHAMLKATDYWLSNFPLVEPVTREGST